MELRFKIGVIFDNPLQAALDSYQCNFRTETFQSSKPAHTAPGIHEEFTDDNGDIQLILENGNTILKEKYIALWLPNNHKI